MKHLLRSTFLIICATTSLFAQKKLTNSRTAGAYTYIYKLTDKEAFSLASVTNQALNDGFLHTLVDSFYNVKNSNYLKKLPYGNYVQVNPVKNELLYKLMPENNVNLQFINNRKDFQFVITDLKGNVIKDAQVKVGKRKTIKYNDKAGLYISKAEKLPVITVRHDGISNYFTYKEEGNYKPRISPQKQAKEKRLYNAVNGIHGTVELKKPKYTGYMVFNKPMYKPLDTVKFKAYLVTAKGIALKDKPLRVELYKEWEGPGTVLTTLNPYREGGYEYSFVLADSLQLKLDRNYKIVLKEETKEGWIEVFQSNFRYEDYELKSVNFSVRSDKNEYSPGNPVTVFLKAVDENDLAVPDGRVEVAVLSSYATNYYDDRVFLKDSLWKTNIVLDPVGETKMVLPDSIFPRADFNFSMSFSFLNSNNERRTARKDLKYTINSSDVKFDLKNDSLHLDYLVQGKSTPQKATVYLWYPYTDVRDSIQVNLPGAIKMDYRVTEYRLKTANGFNDNINLQSLNAGIGTNANQGKDSVRVFVNNPHKIPFWYTVFSEDKVLSKGFTTHLDTIIRHSGAKAAHIKLNYLWGGRELSTETSTFYNPNGLNVKLLSPALVYPGQTVNMQVKVTDFNDRPVAATDVTAYAYTSKFKNGYRVALPSFGKVFHARKLNSQFIGTELSLTGQMRLTWDKWRKELNLDTIEYYKFSQTKDLYAIAEEGVDSLMAVVAPFVVKNGAIEPVHIVFIDDVPVYFSQANQLKRYAFSVKPGKHNIRMRTASHVVSLNDYEFVKGKKTILSVAADEHNIKAGVTAVTKELTDGEATQISQYMIRIVDNFEGEKSTIATDSIPYLLNFSNSNPTPTDVYSSLLRGRNAEKASLLVGPFTQNYLHFRSGGLYETFVKEPGYTYTFLPGLLKQKSYETPNGLNRLLSSVNGAEDYKQYPVKKGEVDSIWSDYLDLRSSTMTLFGNRYYYGKNYGRLLMKVDSSVMKGMPYLKSIIICKYDEPDFLMVYPGNARDLISLESGVYRVTYLFKDNRYFVAKDVRVEARGINYYLWKGVKMMPEDKLSSQIDLQIKSVGIGKKGWNTSEVQQNILRLINDKYLDPAIFTGKMLGRVIDAATKAAIPGVSIRVKGSNYATTTTRADGSFEIKVPERGKIIVVALGYESQEVPVKSGNAGDITLDESLNSLSEVVVVGYGVQKKQNMTGAISSVVGDASVYNFGSNDRVVLRDIRTKPGEKFSKEELMIAIRGIGQLGNFDEQKPLIIVDGIPYSGELSTVNASEIISIDILKDADATAIYGARAAGGVIIVKTKGGNTAVNAAGELVQQEQTMRTNFSDYAIWQPKLVTDEEGKASFTVKFPDDITNWTTRLIAMNGRKQSGIAETNIKSFKTLSANFVSPSFALAGDSIKVIGKLMNYSNADEIVTRKFSYNGAEVLNSAVTFKNAKIDTLSIVAKGGGFKVHADHVNVVDSLRFEYSMKQDNGYFDGEVRKIPLLQAGVTETKGYFNAFTRDTTVNYNFDATLGKVTLRAEASLFPTLLDEIDKLRSYEYLCNEQLASKLKALLLEKTVRKYLSEPFKEEKNIKEILKKLQNNKRPEGTWGWWQNSSEELWISLHVVEALLEAQKQGYPVVLDKDKLYNYLTNKMANENYFDQIYGIRLLSLLNEKYYSNDWIIAMEKQRAELEEKNVRERKANSDVPKLAEQPLYEKLQLMQLKQKTGMPIDMKWLLGLKKETMFGNCYWGEEGRYFWDNSIQNTLLAYQILKTNGSYRDEIDRITRYFLEQRKTGQWRNTFESSLILETILPELINVSGKKFQPASIVLNQTEQVNVFPFHKVIDPATLKLSKKGDAPVYFTAYQQFNNPKPEKVSKDFAVKTYFEQNGESVQKLKAGALTTLKVNVDVRADADYVMIEIPIPAGCSYENKVQSFWGVETHREYFKHKTSIFCTKLKKGTYTFTVQLMPRYSGNYILNPAKAEMMYFPVFYGREGMKRVTIK
ncbi:alpha-2-macroglobulin family protein [Pedobacter hiemivivus]|uniref:Alpha-2-macroglobulin domain-containing protein n=1 Tax=Pedobacter hiemivivus TaxID=2530454 RepID=A0A4R0NIS3_9SPHI|nr:alpha-2-macroglobulin family protein [Pedobacter hiemivivus]TCC98754.1 hypothetical protein EZ444_05625 [Pedobacter hiemivivus]